MKMSFLVLISLVLLASGCNQNLEVASGSERLEDSPSPVVSPNERPLAQAVGDAGEKRSRERPRLVYGLSRFGPD